MRNKTYIETINGAFFAETRPKNSDRTNRFGRCQSNKRKKGGTRTRFRCWKPAIVYNRARIIQLSQFYFIYWFRLWKFMAMCVQCSLLTVQCFSHTWASQPMSNVLWNSNVSTILTLTFFYCLLFTLRIIIHSIKSKIMIICSLEWPVFWHYIDVATGSPTYLSVWPSLGFMQVVKRRTQSLISIKETRSKIFESGVYLCDFYLQYRQISKIRWRQPML